MGDKICKYKVIDYELIFSSFFFVVYMDKSLRKTIKERALANIFKIFYSLFIRYKKTYL